MGGSGGDNGGDSGSDDPITNNNVPLSDGWKTDPSYWKEYQPYGSQNKRNEQCELDENITDGKIEIIYRIKENSALIREAERMGKDQAAQKDVNNLIEQLSLGNNNPGIGNRRVKNLKNVSEARGRNEGRVYFREKDGKIEILAKSNKDNQNKVIGILQKMGY